MPLDSLEAAKKHYSHLNEVLAQLPSRELTWKESAFFEKAVDLASKSQHPRAKIGCLLVEKNSMLASGMNTRKTHPKVMQFKPFALTLCAEMSALFALKKDFDAEKTVAVVARVNFKGEISTSYPCMGCLAALSEKNITKIICCDWKNIPIYIDFS